MEKEAMKDKVVKILAEKSYVEIYSDPPRMMLVIPRDAIEDAAVAAGIDLKALYCHLL